MSTGNWRSGGVFEGAREIMLSIRLLVMKRSLMNNRIRAGYNTESCRTPLFIALGEEQFLSTIAEVDCFERNLEMKVQKRG